MRKNIDFSYYRPRKTMSAWNPSSSIARFSEDERVKQCTPKALDCISFCYKENNHSQLLHERRGARSLSRRNFSTETAALPYLPAESKDSAE